MDLSVLKADITGVSVDIIVNAANPSLSGGGGVDGAIHRKGGPGILEECQQIRNRQGPCKTGSAVITTAGNLPAKYVIHTVGPVWNGGNADERQKLADCYQACLELCVKHDCRSIAFPCISTGVYGFPKKQAAQIALATVKGFDHGNAIDQVIFVCFDDESFQIYQSLMH